MFWDLNNFLDKPSTTSYFNFCEGGNTSETALLQSWVTATLCLL